MKDYLAVVQEKRQQALKDKEQSKLHKELLNASSSSSNNVAAVITRQAAKTRLHSSQTAPVAVKNLPDLALREDMNKVVTALEAIKTENKPKDVDFTPLAQAVNALGQKIDSLPKETPTLTVPNTIKISNLSELKADLDNVKKAVERKDYKPVNKIEVKPTPVKVEIPPIDVSGIEQAIRDKHVEEKEEIKLSDFRAQDLDDAAPSVQYAGLIHPLGYWQIIENNREDNTLRYKFGYGEYQQAWKDRVGQKYKLLDEAYRELSA